MNEKLFFYIFASIALIAASGVICSKHLVKSMLWLVTTFIATAILWLLLKAEFLALMLALIYIGAVLVLFLFIIMLFDLNFYARDKKFSLIGTCGVIISVLLTGVLCYAIILQGFNNNGNVALIRSIKFNELLILSKLLFTEYLPQVEMVGILLLVAIVATISLTVKRTK
jgi:NADH-quinone oxidoreductase subunit J